MCARRNEYHARLSMGPGSPIDSVLCAVQAAWAYTKKNESWGVPEECDRDEGWILDPQLLAKDG